MSFARKKPMARTAWKRKPPEAKESKPSKLPPRPPRAPKAKAPPREDMRSARKKFEQKQRRDARREARGEADEPYLQWLRRQICGLAAWALEQWRKHRIAVDIGPCGNGTEADHERGGGREGPGMGQRAPDRRAWPCCHDHHQERHGAANGFWGRMSKDEKAAFIAARIDEYRARYLAELAAGGPFGGM